MDSQVPNRTDVDAFIALAERIEHESRDGASVGPMLAELDHLLASFDRQAVIPATELPDPASRMQNVVDQLRRSVASGHVRSISGLTRESRRFVRQLET